MSRFLAIILCATAALALVVSLALGADDVELLDSSVVTGQVLSIGDGKIEVKTGEQTREIAQADLAALRFADAPRLMAQRGYTVVLTAGGYALSAGSLVADSAKDAVTFRNPLLGKAQLKFADVAVIYLPKPELSPAAIEARCVEYAFLSKSYDMIVVERKDGKWVSFEGVFKGLTDKKVLFTYKDEERSVDRAIVPAIRLVTQAKTPAGQAGTVTGADGSTLGFTQIKLDAKTAEFVVPGLGVRSVSRSELASIEFRSDRVVNLGDLKPVAVKEYGLFDKTFTHRVDLSAGGKPLRLGGKTFPRGLGLHSYAEITYDLAGEYATFVAVAGIDDDVRPRGDATLSFIGDGKLLAEAMELTGTGAPVPVRVPVKGVKQFTIKVEFGPDKLPVSDHVDLGAARLIK